MSFVLALDAGHGPNTPGKRMPDGTRENTLNRGVCKYLTNMLKEYDVKIVRLDDVNGNKDTGLIARMNKAVAEDADACISVHHNAGPTPTDGKEYGNYTGVEVIVNTYASPECKELANNILKYLPDKTGLKSRGLKNSTYFTMVMKKPFPTMIIEGGFMNGVKDAKVLKTKEYQKGYAKAILKGLLDTYPEIKKLNDKKETNKVETPKTEPVKTETVKEEKKKVKMKTTAKLWLRKSPEVNDTNKLTVMPKGAEVVVKNTDDPIWYKVKYNSVVGYCSSKYLA